MFAYYRTSSYNTYIQRILQGSISNSDSSDLILVKGNSLEWMSIDHVNDSNLNILTSQLQQSVFGTITDANILHCHFHNNDDDEHNTFNFMDKETEVFEEVKYTKKTRHHSPIKGEDIIVTLSEYGKLIFMSIHHNKLLDIKRFETLAEVHLNSPGLEYTKIDKKLAIDP
ncbi:uncharacterized protein BX663DRAFT_481843 [Cokeromyces recurvatus]|uniref:uncharacterized protein n=1 Tax=Cokeromyces recurvatus TaxID=90255 RepID=UPI002220DD0D|nr:uncharacterized protein BX663DRAFT_481843 [Cokeromyces recurvatus]KAI7907514.1 hypothetical protein BX663DRAFT_481843 [Cokeromyces recurvatus]